MAIDARIPLGVQPVQQQPNMLAQYAQIMGIKAAQQEMQGSEEMRNLFAGGANFDDPEFQRRGYQANPKQFQELLGKRATTQKTEMEALAKEIELRRDALVNVNTPEDYLKWHESNHQGKMGNFLKSIGQTPSRESIVAKLSQPGGLDKLKTNSALGATRLAQEVYNTQRTRISSGASYGQLDLSKKKDAREQAVFDLIQSALTGGATPSTTAPVAPPMGGGSGPAAAPVAGSPASTNVLRDQVAPQGGAAPVSSVGVNNLTAQPSVVAPVTSPTTAPAALTKDEQVKEIDLKIEKLSMIPDPRAKSAVEMLLKRREILEPTKGPLVNINMPEDKKSFEMKVGPEGTKFAYKGLEKAQNAAEIINNVNVGKSILDKGMISGFGANFLVGLNQALKTGGIDFGYADASANSQAYAAAMAQNVGKLITLFGAGTGLSDADRAYAEQMAAGKINLDEAALRKILRINEDVSRRGIESHNKKMKQMGAPDYLQVEIPFEPPADIKDLWPYMTPEDKMLWQK
jgi:hypothetical protein